MHEDLLGYVLGALDRDATERIESELRGSAELRRELDRIRRAMKPLADTTASFDPPPGLAQRTVRKVFARRYRPVEPYVTPAGPWRLSDLAVAASILVLISSVIFPALSEARQRKQVVECSNNLRAIGVALHSYAQEHSDYLPFFSARGPMAVASVYAPILLETGLVTDRATFLCPGSVDRGDAIRPISQLNSAVDDLRRLTKLMGGSYAYSLGFTENGRYHAPRLGRMPGRSVLGDRANRPAEGEVGQTNSPNHQHRGQNMLQCDGSVKHFCVPRECPGCDNFYLSARDRVEPGRNSTDSVLAAGDAPINPDSQF